VLHALKTERLMIKANIKAFGNIHTKTHEAHGTRKTENSICPLKKR
jgi:hypothetical protein